MKSKTIFPTLISLILSLFCISCDKSPLDQPLSKCNLSGNLVLIEDKIGELVFTDTIPGLKFDQKEYFVLNYGIDSIYLSLKPCNLPEVFKQASLNSPVLIKFSGNIQSLPITADAASLNFEFSKIKLIEK
jgi:hypothetical protein